MTRVNSKPVAALVAGTLLILGVFPTPTSSFTVPFCGGVSVRQTAFKHYVSKVEDTESTDSNDDDEEYMMSDEQLLQDTSKKQLASLCEQFSLSTKGTKEELLKRLRDFANAEQKSERQRLLDRRKRVEEGGDDSRERFEIVDGGVFDEEEEDDNDGVFFYYPSLEKENSTLTQGKTSSFTKKSNSQAPITAPPPPPIEPDENGERVVTVYSTTDQNDLTGVAASQPGQAASGDPMTSNFGDPADAPWDMNGPKKKDSTSIEIDAAKAEVSDLVQSLLAMSGAQAFQEEADDLSFLGVVRQGSSYAAPEGFVGFDPSQVPTDMLTKASKSLRTGRGQVLHEVIREFELRAVGHDGAFGDNAEKGGGHYRQVSKVRSFLEGFRRAEVRRLARETGTLLLDKLVAEGIEGLDIILASMSRSSDDRSDEAGELNDSLLDYLNDAIRNQEKKVEQIVDSVKKIAEFEKAVATEDPEDQVEKLWTVDSEEGERVETFNPKDPKNSRILQDEYKKAVAGAALQPIIPASAPEKLLLLLKLLRERIKTEAVFSHDEKSRNLRVLAYCLRLSSDDQRRELIVKEFGVSLDRLDSFTELVSSSIEYGESTSHQLQPSKQGSLNVNLLKSVLALTNETKEKMSWKASGAISDRLNP